MRVVSHIPAGSRVLEQYGTGAWRPVPARCNLILLACPRTVDLGTAAAVVGPSAGAQFQSHVGQMVESRMFAQFLELEPAERKRRRQEQEQRRQQQQQRPPQPPPHSTGLGPSLGSPYGPAGSPPYLSACVCGDAGSSVERCTVCNVAWWCARCFASQCTCVTEDDRRGAAADALSGVIDLRSPTAPTSRVGGMDEAGVQPVLVTSRDAWAEVAGFSDAYPTSGYTRMPGGADEAVRPLLAGTMLYIPGVMSDYPVRNVCAEVWACVTGLQHSST